MVEYAPHGLIGVLTPQANTTVEPEFMALCPPGVGLLTARLTSDAPTIDDRLADYVLSMDRTLDRFANAPLDAVAFACTGASYLVDPEEEAATLAAIEARRGYPLITAVNAIADALAALGARRVGVVSPYGDALHARALDYWAGRGLEIAGVARIKSADEAFHPIYALGASASRERMAALDGAGAEAIVMLGTGLPTLPAILETRGEPAPVISPNLCLMWRAVRAAQGGAPDRDSLAPWLSGAEWGPRLRARMG